MWALRVPSCPHSLVRSRDLDTLTFTIFFFRIRKMPGRPEEEESQGHTHDDGRGRANEDRGFLIELVGILALNSLGEIPGLNWLKQMYARVKDRFTVSKQCSTDRTNSDLKFKGRTGLEGQRSGFVCASDGLGDGDRRTGCTPLFQGCNQRLEQVRCNHLRLQTFFDPSHI